MARIVLIHATRLSIDPVEAAFAAGWPEAEVSNLLDESLLLERRAAGGLTPAIRWRIGAHAQAAMSAGADAILYTCSAFGPAILAAAETVPVPCLKPYTPMVEAGLDRGTRLAVFATFAGTVPEIRDELEGMARARGQALELSVTLVEGAMEALAAGDPAAHDAAILGAAAGCPADAILLAQFSMARVAGAVAAHTGRPVLTAPDSAVRKLRELLPA